MLRMREGRREVERKIYNERGRSGRSGRRGNRGHGDDLANGGGAWVVVERACEGTGEERGSGCRLGVWAWAFSLVLGLVVI